MIIVDGTSYNVNATVTEDGDFLYQYADRTVDGVLHSKLIGVYYNYKMSIFQPSASQLADYNALWIKITEATEFHTVTVPNVSGFDYSYKAYMANCHRKLVMDKVDGNYWEDTTVDFIAQSPAKIPT